MKRIIALIAALAVLCAALPAMAEMAVTVEKVGKQRINEEDLEILRFQFSQEGREIPDLYALMNETGFLETIFWSLEDVNGDGYDDLVFPTAIGASNAVYTFYLWNEEAGAFEGVGGDELWNYQLYPAQGLVLSQGTSGLAGLLHESRVYGWSEDGRSLQLLRSSVWENLSEFITEEDGARFSERYDTTVLVETYIDYVTGEETTFTFPLQNYEDDPAFAAQRFLVEDDFLGLEVTPEAIEDGTNG